jgi:hypothetical protein
MSKNQVRWAMQHDWFVSAYELDGAYIVQACDGLETETFADFDELYAWAGY